MVEYLGEIIIYILCYSLHLYSCICPKKFFFEKEPALEKTERDYDILQV